MKDETTSGCEYEMDPQVKQKILEQVQAGKPEEVLYAIKWVIALRKVKAMPVEGPNAGKWEKQRVEPIEKLVRIQAAILTLPPELRGVVLDEAENRIQCVEQRCSKYWELILERVKEQERRHKN